MRDVLADVTGWLERSWDPDLTVGEWWERLGTSGWAAPAWPRDWYGQGLTPQEATQVARRIAQFGALGAPGGLGMALAGPTILEHGDDDQRKRYLADIVTGRRAWCQLFSEPQAGSDLAGLVTRAERDGDEWVVNGQKVWTSGAQTADLGMLVARTDPDQPKHSGLSYFAFDMHQPGVEVRPLREMTGHALFNEVFITDARVADDAVIGGLNNGWRVANTTLWHERGGAGGGGGGSAATPGTVAGHLERRAGDFVGRRGGAVGGVGGVGALAAASSRVLVELARRHGRLGDPAVRQDLARLHTLEEVGRMGSARLKAVRAAGGDIPGFGNIAKLRTSLTVQLSRQIATQVLGPLATLHAYGPEGRAANEAATGRPELAGITEMVVFSPAPSIYGGTDQVQKNILGERVLGLPKEPGHPAGTPFKDLPRS